MRWHRRTSAVAATWPQCRWRSSRTRPSPYARPPSATERHGPPAITTTRLLSCLAPGAQSCPAEPLFHSESFSLFAKRSGFGEKIPTHDREQNVKRKTLALANIGVRTQVSRSEEAGTHLTKVRCAKGIASSWAGGSK